MHDTYSVSQRHISSSKGALIDRRANGGLAGSDTQVLSKTDCVVNIQGINNHQVTNIPIVTAAGVVDSQRGPVVLIMNQYAHLPSGHTIHSSAQLEPHGMIVDDKAVPNGGRQTLTTPCGYVIPFHF